MVVEPRETHRLVRRATRSLKVGASLSGGVDVVIDCVGSAKSIEEDLAVVRPGGDVVLLGMPSTVTVDLTPLWHRQIRVRGSYAYGTESVDGESPAHVRPRLRAGGARPAGPAGLRPLPPRPLP